MNYIHSLLAALFLISSLKQSSAQNQFENIIKIAATKGYSITPLPGDYDGDGDMDILGTGYYTHESTRSNATVLFRNDGDEFSLVDIQLPRFYDGGMYQWADIDNDNDLDILAGGCTSSCYNSKMLSIYRNEGNETFNLITHPTNLVGGKQFSLSDFDNDGLIDIEIATLSNHNGNVIGRTFYKNEGNAVFQNVFELAIQGGEVAWGDLDNDGWIDFVLLDKAYKNLRNGTFEVFPSVSLPSTLRHFLFDADNDNDLDVISGNGSFMQNDGSGHLSLATPIVPYSNINDLVIADFDGDGNKDILASGGSIDQRETQLFRSNGDGTFTPTDLYEQYSYAFSLALADMDNDNDPDVLASNVFLDEIIILVNELPTSLSKPQPPSSLLAQVNAETVTFSWNAALDEEQSALKYNLYLMRGDQFVITPLADLSSGLSLIPDASNSNTNLQKQFDLSTITDGYFRWSVQAVDDESNTSEFATPQEFTFYRNNPANSPTNLLQTDVQSHQISLSWTDNAFDELTYTIERSTLGGNTGFDDIGQLQSNANTFTDNSVLPRSIYYYRIRMNGPLSVGYSNVIRIETNSVIPTAPHNVTANPLNSATIRIEWEYSGSPVNGFVIERSFLDKKSFNVIDTVSVNDLFYIDRKIESGKIYYYRLYAVRAMDFSDYSTTVQASSPPKEFNKITLPSLIYEAGYNMGGVAWGDYDNDGFDDLFLGYKAQLFHNKGDGTFEKIINTGITSAELASYFVAVWGDYDNDGSLDIFYYNEKDKSYIYRGHGNGTFTKITTNINANRTEITNATWTDIDSDGDLDLSMSGDRYVYRYDGDDIFSRVDFTSMIPSKYYSSSVASWADYDDDGDLDVFLGNYGHDELLRNNGDGSFVNVTDQRITVDYNYDCCPIRTPVALWSDFNNDCKLDLTVYHSGDGGPIYGYTNDNNNFDSTFYFFGISNSLFFTDYDNDGDQDLFSMGQFKSRANIWINRDGHFSRPLRDGPLYEDTGTESVFSWNDFDNDGYADLFKFDTNREIYKNLSNGNSWIKFRLKGTDSNSTGLGAKVFIKSDNVWQRADVTTHHGYQVQQGFMILFGLGTATQIDSVKIYWPSGNRQYFTHLDVNQVIYVDETQAQEKVAQAPSNLSAEVLFPSSIILRWNDRSKKNAGSIIEMMSQQGQFIEIGTVSAGIDSFKVNNLSSGINYKFRVRSSVGPGIKSTNIVETEIKLFNQVFAGDLNTLQAKPEGMAWGDPDNDGDPDLFVGSQSFEPDAIYYNNAGTFKRSYLRSNSNYSRQAQWVDYDNDGYQDLHISTGGGIIASTEALNDYLYKNNGEGKLIEQTKHILSNDGHPDYAAAWGDLNNDGYLEMITPRSGNSTSIFLNLGGNFVPQPEALDLNLPSEATLLLWDLDDDRDLDIITSSLYGNSGIYENVKGQFVRKTDLGAFYSIYSLVVQDFNNDGINDILGIDDRQAIRLYLFDPVLNIFKEKPNVFPKVGNILKLSVGDFDNNGFLDVLVIGEYSFNTNTNRLFLNNGNLNFTSITDPLLKYRLYGAAIADFNKDGHLDLIALATDNNYNTNGYLLEGTENLNHWLRIKLKGLTANSFGIGARIRLFSGNESQVRDMRSGTAGTFSDEQIAHFGIGTSTSIDYIKVEWPTGEDQWIENPAINTEITVEQASSPAPPSPESPSQLTATFLSPGYVDLRWIDQSNEEKLFRIERAIGTSSFKFFKEVPANTNSFIDSTFVDYTTRPLDVRYRVIAVSYFLIKSVPSNEALVSVITDIGEDANKGLVIYPQPAYSSVFIQNEYPITKINIMGSRGEIIKSLTVPELNQIEVPLSGFTTGLYLFQVISNGKSSIRKVIVHSSN